MFSKDIVTTTACLMTMNDVT